MTETSKTFQHAASLYEALLSRSEIRDFGTHVERVFQGKITAVYRDLEISQAHYSKVRRVLVDQGCITYLQVGARSEGSVIALHHPPSADEFKRTLNRPLTGRLDYATLTQRVEDLQRQLGGLDVIAALADMENRIRSMQREIDQLKGIRPHRKP